MNDRPVVRFQEWTRYDPINDEQRVRFLGITGMGTFHAEVPMIEGEGLRLKREAFRGLVLEAMGNGERPKEITIG